MNIYGTYVTALELAQYFKLFENRDISNLIPDGRLPRLVERVSRRFESVCGRRHFLPWHETRTYDHPVSARHALLQTYSQFRRPYASPSRDAIILDLDEDLLDLKTLITNNGATTLAASSYQLSYFDRFGFRPYNKVRLIWTTDTSPVFTYTSTPQGANTVAGVWGYHEDYTRAWQSVGTLNGAITASATTITVTDVDGEDERGASPRYHQGYLLRVGANDQTAEYMYIRSEPDVEQNQLTVVRGVNGTTAQAWNSGETTYVYRPMDDIQQGVLELAIYTYRRQGTIGNESDQPFAASGVLTLPSEWPRTVRDLIRDYRRERHGTGRGFAA